MADQQPNRPREDNVPPFLVKPYSNGDLQRIYGLSNKTLLKWLKPFRKQIGKRNGRYYNVVQVKVIISLLGLPHRIDPE